MSEGGVGVVLRDALGGVGAGSVSVSLCGVGTGGSLRGVGVGGGVSVGS